MYFQEYQNDVDRFRKESDLLKNADAGEGGCRGETEGPRPLKVGKKGKMRNGRKARRVSKTNTQIFPRVVRFN